MVEVGVGLVLLQVVQDTTPEPRVVAVRLVVGLRRLEEMLVQILEVVVVVVLTIMQIIKVEKAAAALL